nr:immunoglobulin heavy chain junction region [Mus musculus]
CARSWYSNSYAMDYW